LGEETAHDCALGVDLLSGSPLSKTDPPLYSAVLLCSDGHYRAWDEVTLARVFRLAWEAKPKALAVDSPQELAPSRRVLLRIGELLPPETNLVWVSFAEEGPLALSKIAAQQGLAKEGGKLTSRKTAYLAALLALRGFGKPVFRKSEAAKVVVRRARVEGKGGMSSNRYKRKVRSVVKQLAGEVQSALQAAKIEYEAYFKRGRGGLEKAVFIAYAPLDVVKKVVSPKEFQDAVVEIKPLVKLLALEEPEENRPLIVGIDPGYNFGLAIMDIEGNVLHVGTLREASRSEVIDRIRRYGKPVLIATDVRPVPETVKKLASTLRSKLFVPRESIESARKREIAEALARAQEVPLRDSHSRDALVAAYMAYREVREKLREAEEYLSKTGLSLPAELVKMKVVAGKSIAEAVEEALSDLLAPGEGGSEARLPAKRGTDYSGALELVERLSLEKELLSQELRKKQEELERLEEEIARLRSKRAETSLDKRAELLYGTLSALSSRLRAVEEELNATKEKVSYLVEKLSEVSSKRAVALLDCGHLAGLATRSASERAPRVDYCYARSLAEISVETVESAGVKGVAILEDCSSDEFKRALNVRGVGVLCCKERDCDCEVIEERVAVCAPRVLRELSEEAERAKQFAAESERQRILKLLREYRESERERASGIRP